ELGKPVVMLMPKGASKLGLRLRQRAFNQSIEQHQSQNAFWKRIAEDGTALIFEDATDLSRQLAQLFNQWAANLPAALAAAAEAILPPPPPAPPVPGASGAPPREAPVPRGLPMLDVDTLSDQIAEKTAAKLLTYQQNQQQNLAEQAVKVNEALRLWPGELVFGRPAKSQQFQSDVFVVMPFAAAFAPVYTDIIKPLAAELKLTILRGDELSSSRGSIMEEVWAALNACRFVIAEITGGNDNVFYELGIAHTLNKPAILITQAAAPEAVPFDIRHLRYVRYENTPEGGVRLRSDLQTVITRLLAELDAVDSA
ncbi:MAG TPA: hypothetical protein VHO69_13900, partial [Phototrophicaceae bacterium]|nr:hypothetical protein [Phototrophicaceae bacterium]